MIEIKEWTWKAIPKKEMTAKTITCPYCGVRVQAGSTTRIVDTATGAIKYQIHKCPECFMPVIIGLDGKIIPQSQLLPYEDVRFLPPNVEKLYNEGLIVVRNYKSCGWGRERCDRKGHAVFLRPRVDSAIMGSASTGISTSSTKLKKISTFCRRLPPDLSGA